MDELYRKLLAQLEEGQDTVLAFITEGDGSIPRTTGAYMLVGREGRIFGTIGGGNLEYQLHFHGNASFFFSFVYKIYRLPKHTVCRPYSSLHIRQISLFEKFRQFVRVFYFYVVLRFCKIIGQSFSPVCLRWENKLSFGCSFIQTAAGTEHDKDGCSC